jgi:hypothetical protein
MVYPDRDKHLRPFFGGMKPDQVTKELIKDFITEKLEPGYANATVNRILALLKRSYSLAEIRCPTINKLKEAAPRKGPPSGDPERGGLPSHQRIRCQYIRRRSSNHGELRTPGVL